MNFNKVIVPIMMCFNTLVFAGNEGGGGGGFCVANKCYTLAEAGFDTAVVVESNTGQEMAIPVPPISEATYKEMERVLQFLMKQNVPFSPDLGVHERFINKIFVRVNAYDPKKVKSITDIYLNILKEQNFKTGGFTLFAISNSDNTYLLPEFYKLNTTSQALVLIHESWMRIYWKQICSGSICIDNPKVTYIEALKIILGLDAAYLEILNGNKNVIWKTFYPASKLSYVREPNFQNAMLNAGFQLMGEITKSGSSIRIPSDLNSFLRPSNFEEFNLPKQYDVQPIGATFKDFKIFELIKNQMPVVWSVMSTHGVNALRLIAKNNDSDISVAKTKTCMHAEDGAYLTSNLFLNGEYGIDRMAVGIIECKKKKPFGKVMYLEFLKLEY